MLEHRSQSASAGPSVSALMTRFKIGTRVFAGFILILVLLGVVALIGTLGMNNAGGNFYSFARISDNAMRVLEIDRDIAELRRDVALYAGNRDDATLRRVEELKKALENNLVDAEKNEASAEGRQMLDGMKGLYRDYINQFEKVVQLRAKRDHVLNDELKPAGLAMRENLTKARVSAMADKDLEAAALIAGMEEERMLAWVNALRLIDSPDQKLVDIANDQITKLSTALAQLENELQNPDRKQLLRQTLEIGVKYAAAFKAMSAATLEAYSLVDGPMDIAAEEFANGAGAVKQSQITALRQIETTTTGNIHASTLLGFATAIAAFVLGLVVAFVIGRGIAAPIRGMTAAMGRLAGGDKLVVIPGVSCRDEIGEMAQSVQVFKDKMIKAEQLAAEQQAEQVKKERRHQAIEAHIAEFDQSVAGILQSVSSAATALQTTAQSMSATAEQTSRQSTAVAAASEQASANVHTVATAANKLSSSIAEITRQVGESTRITTQAVQETRRTNSQIHSLAEAAQKIGEVVAADQRYRQPDQPAGAECDDRGGARRRGREGLRGGGLGGEVAGDPDGEGDRRDQRQGRRDAERNQRVRSKWSKASPRQSHGSTRSPPLSSQRWRNKGRRPRRSRATFSRLRPARMKCRPTSPASPRRRATPVPRQVRCSAPPANWPIRQRHCAHGLTGSSQRSAPPRQEGTPPIVIRCPVDLRLDIAHLSSAKPSGSARIRLYNAAPRRAHSRQTATQFPQEPNQCGCDLVNNQPPGGADALGYAEDHRLSLRLYAFTTLVPILGWTLPVKVFATVLTMAGACACSKLRIAQRVWRTSNSRRFQRRPAARLSTITRRYDEDLRVGSDLALSIKNSRLHGTSAARRRWEHEWEHARRAA